MTFRRALFAAAPLNTDTITHRLMPPFPGYGPDGRPAWPFLGTQPGDQGGGAASGGAGGQGSQGGQGGGQGGQQGSGPAGQQGQGGDGGASPFTPPKDQAELDKLIGDRLARERAKYADYDEAKRKAAEYDKATEAQKTELQKATDRAAEAERQASEREARALRAEVALEKGLTASQAKRLVGKNRDELIADADELLKDLGTGKSGQGGGQGTNFDAGNQGGSVKPTKGEAGRLAAQKRYGKKADATTGATST
jgi:hypothetical protein